MPEEVDHDHVLSDDADGDADAWLMRPHLLRPLAEALLVLGEDLPQGFTFRATWTGSPARTHTVLRADELAALVLASGLDEHTAYQVPAR